MEDNLQEIDLKHSISDTFLMILILKLRSLGHFYFEFNWFINLKVWWYQL